jgi:separase
VYDNLLNAITFNKKSIFKYYEKSIQTQIPEDWTIISFIINDSQLYLLRLERNRVPFLFKLENFNEKVLEKFKQIIKENDASMKQNDKKKFWEIRGALNKRLIEYLKDIDKNLFDFARYFLLGSYSDKKVMKKCEEEIKKFYDKFGLKLEGLAIDQKQIVFYIFNFLFDGKILNQELTQKRLQENLKSAFKYAKFNENDCDKFYEYIYDNYINGDFKMGKLKRNHVCLLIDKNLHQIPWECLPIVEKQSITRMPSMHFLSILLETSKTKISKNNAYYIVDPAGDLVHTKQKFEALFENQTGWEGIIGRSPDESEFKKALTEFELFM